MGLIAKARDIFLGPNVGRDSSRTTMAVVAQANDEADRFLRMVVSGRPLCGSVMQPAANVGSQERDRWKFNDRDETKE